MTCRFSLVKVCKNAIQRHSHSLYRRVVPWGLGHSTEDVVARYVCASIGRQLHGSKPQGIYVFIFGAHSRADSSDCTVPLEICALMKFSKPRRDPSLGGARNECASTKNESRTLRALVLSWYGSRSVSLVYSPGLPKNTLI